MKAQISLSTLFGFFCLECAILSCTPPPGPAPMPPDASDASPPPSTYDGSTTSACYHACQALAAAGCAEGSSLLCVTRLQTVNDLRTERNPAHGNQALTCNDVAAVQSAADVVKIGQTCSPLPPSH